MQHLNVKRVQFPNGARAYQINDGDSPLAWIDVEQPHELIRAVYDAIEQDGDVLVNDEGTPIASR